MIMPISLHMNGICVIYNFALIWRILGSWCGRVRYTITRWRRSVGLGRCWGGLRRALPNGVDKRQRRDRRDFFPYSAISGKARLLGAA